MNPMKKAYDHNQPKAKPFKFSDSFLTGFNTMISAYDKKIEELHKVSSLIDNGAHHGVCNCSYRLRYITPSDVSTFISNLEKAMENHLLKPNTSDCNMFAVESVKKFLKQNGCCPFDASNIMGNPGANIPKGATLNDLVFAAESEVFNLLVYSQYELKKRVECMKEDIDKIQNMHFSAAMKSFVNKIPDIMDKNAGCVMMDALSGNALVNYIEDFIVFSIRLNLTTVLQMLRYAVPKVSYKEEPKAFDKSNEPSDNADNWDEDNEFFKQEAVDSSAVSPVFFVFTEGKTPILSKAISKATNSPFTHISISFDPSLENMYSFGGVGVRKESIKDRVREDLDISVFGTFIERNNVNKMKDICTDFISHKTKATFDYPALVKKLFGSDKKNNSGYRQICTTFVNRLLTEIDHPLSEKNIPSPAEMHEAVVNKPNQIFELYQGSSEEYNKKKAEDLLKAKGKEKKAKAFDEVVTECCMLKTNDYHITNRIPFNCNMRDIVLQDMHPEFKDTISALKFIMNDERSPIHQLVIQYFTEPIDEYDPYLIIKMFFGCPRHDHWEGMNGREVKANADCGMNTDVNWLDKITYGNMFYDGNYRRDALGNNHVRPIMNTFESIYKMFGGCDNDCDNEKLANNLIRISRVMKAIVENWCSGMIPNWEMCRDILSVFGEIFTRNMLRLYYNNNRVLPADDHMDSTMIPGYMYAESFVMESNGFKSNNGDNTSNVKTARINIRNVASNFAGWLRNTLAKYIPKFFKENLYSQCEWVKKNAAAKFEEIYKANKEGKYNLPSKEGLKMFNVTADPSKVNPEEIIKKYIDQDSIDEKAVKRDLLSMFSGNVLDDLMKIEDKEELKKGVTNAFLYSSLEPIAPKNGEIGINDFAQIYKDLDTLSKDDMPLTKAFESLGEKMGKAVESLKNMIPADKAVTTESFVFTESETNETKKAAEASEPPAVNSGTDDGRGQENRSAGDSNTDTNKKSEDKKVANAKTLFGIFQAVGSGIFVTLANSVTHELYPTVYNNFKGIVDDYDSMKNKASNATSQQTTQAEQNMGNANNTTTDKTPDNTNQNN